MLTPICDNILQAIGGTPMVRINRLTRGATEATVLAKIETFNPGNSIKDHRTGVESGDVQRVLDGDIEQFIEASLTGRTTSKGSGGAGTGPAD